MFPWPSDSGGACGSLRDEAVRIGAGGAARRKPEASHPGASGPGHEYNR